MKERRHAHLLPAAGLALQIVLAACLRLLAQAPAQPQVEVLRIEGVIGPPAARYLTRELSERSDAHAIVLVLDTPGGLESSMREMTQALLESKAPVITYVAPAGARAASAGMFLTLAGHVAVMAPGTNIGAAHPVGLGGGNDDDVQADKATHDAAALARSIARARGRNAQWAERAVRESVSITAEEALQEKVIDLLAPDLQSALQRVDGRTLTTRAGTITLRTAGAKVNERAMSLPERILQTITDPNIAYLLFSLGWLGLLAELYNPGGFVPGIVGLLSLVLAFTAFGTLPMNWAGLLLIVLAVGLFVAELWSESLGVLGFGGLAAFVLGSLMLYRPLSPTSPAMPDVQVSPWLIALTTAVIALFLLGVVRAVVRAQRHGTATGPSAMVGRNAVATSELTPHGTVNVEGEVWTANAQDPPIHEGEAVTITGVHGVTLDVTRPAHVPRT